MLFVYALTRGNMCSSLSEMIVSCLRTSIRFCGSWTQKTEVFACISRISLFFLYVAENYFSATCWAIQIVLCLKKIESWMKRKGFMPAFEDNLFFWHVVEKYFSLTCWAIYTFLFYQNWHFFSSPKKKVFETSL